MKKRLVFPVLLVLSIAVLAEASGKGAPWNVIKKAAVNHPVNVAGFLNASFGITVGYSGETHYTTDGAKKWPKSKNQSACRFGLEILDAKFAWSCGNSGHVRMTSDGGKTWRAVADFGVPSPEHCRYLSFVDKNTGWIASPTSLALTVDGAKTWKNVKLPKGIKYIAAISLLDANDGYVLSSDGVLYITSNMGNTWSKCPLGLKASDVMLKPQGSVPQGAMRFTDKDNGIIVFWAFKPSNGWVAMVTADGGKTWKKEKFTAELGSPFLAHDGKTLTIFSMISPNAFVLKHK